MKKQGERTRFFKAPLPFIGQKRYFLKHLEKVLDENIVGDGEGWTIVDVFGGSGLLSHNVKWLKPKAHVVYNDFDGYAERLKHIGDINRLRQILFDFAEKSTIPTKGRFSKEQKTEIIRLINNFQGYKDLKTLSTWILFSGKQSKSFENLCANTFWNRVIKTDYPLADGYLDGIEIVNESFHTLISRYQNKEKVLLLLDPPYLCTQQDTYHQEEFFDLIDFLHLINLTRPPFIFFSSTKSELIRFLDYIKETKTHNHEAFDGYQKVSINAQLNKFQGYEDNMIYKF